MHFPILQLWLRSLLTVALSACFFTGNSFAEELVTETAPPIIAETDYLLRQGDVLQIKVFQHDDLTRETSVSQEFTISLPLIGTVDLRNRSVRQAEEMIRSLYDRDYLVNPQVTVFVIRYAERSVNVIGMVNQPQAVPFPPERGLTLMQAISRAGGFNRLGDPKRVTLTRKDANGQTQTFRINVEKLLDSSSDNSWPLQVDDVIRVPERTF